MPYRTRWSVVPLALAAAALVAACNRTASVDDVALGSQVAVTTVDGSTVEGQLVDVTERALVIQRPNTGRRDRIERVSIAEVAKTGDGTLVDAAPDEPTSHDISVPAGTLVPVTLDVALGSDSSHAEDSVTATVRLPVTVEGFDVIPVGATLVGSVTKATPSGDVTGRAALAFTFDRLVVGDSRYAISVDPIVYQASSSMKKDAAKIGGGAAVGSLVGAIAGGKKGAAIGAAVGGAAGTAVVLTTPGGEVHLPKSTDVAVELLAPVVVTVDASCSGCTG